MYVLIFTVKPQLEKLYMIWGVVLIKFFCFMATIVNQIS